ncbi:hypothetical protein DFH11DRAFT_1777010 [Phellopilus nigrolimitatus]|nr:hypothetical protein DFH11DRAFT_1777010 [Phellopilus nigrolimitatus]
MIVWRPFCLSESSPDDGAPSISFTKPPSVDDPNDTAVQCVSGGKRNSRERRECRVLIQNGLATRALRIESSISGRVDWTDLLERRQLPSREQNEAIMDSLDNLLSKTKAFSFCASTWHLARPHSSPTSQTKKREPRIYAVDDDLHFAYLEINPLIVLDVENRAEPIVHFLDIAAKWCLRPDSRLVYVQNHWCRPRPTDGLARPLREAAHRKLDGWTGASLKLTVLNPEGHGWTTVATYFLDQMSNEQVLWSYDRDATTTIDLATRDSSKPDDKILIIGTGTANFTNVASTFKRIIRALKEYKASLIAHSESSSRHAVRALTSPRSSPERKTGVQVRREFRTFYLTVCARLVSSGQVVGAAPSNETRSARLACLARTRSLESRLRTSQMARGDQSARGAAPSTQRRAIFVIVSITGTYAGKDLISSLETSLLTIGSCRFCDALNEAAFILPNVCDTGLRPRESVDESRKANKLISGIGHNIKSDNNFGLRVMLTREQPSTSQLRARSSEGRKSTLILNVDRGNAVCFVNLLRFRPFPRTALSKPRWLSASPAPRHPRCMRL